MVTKESFIDWLDSPRRALSDKSIKNYAGGITAISKGAKKSGLISVDSLYLIEKSQELRSIKERYFSIGEYKRKDVRGKKMYSCAFNLFIAFVEEIEKSCLPEKIARICWNSNGWLFPSGRQGKSANKDSYEYMNGFGHEEWNFDIDKAIDGYVYGFLQQFHALDSAHRGCKYKVSFYSIERVNSNLKRRWWIGDVKSVEVINPEESRRVYNIYKENGWLDAMEAALTVLQLNPAGFKETPLDAFFNIRFKVDDMALLDTPMEFMHTDPAVSSNYYNLLDKKINPDLPFDQAGDFKFESGHTPGVNSTTVNSSGGVASKSLLHNEMQTQIHTILADKYGKVNVGSENALGYQTRVDLVLRKKKSFTFYEIKTSSTAKAAIREALGQIMEYAYWPDKNNADELIIVAPHASTIDVEKYLARLRESFSIPVYYQQYVLGTRSLGQRV